MDNQLLAIACFIYHLNLVVVGSRFKANTDKIFVSHMTTKHVREHIYSGHAKANLGK